MVGLGCSASKLPSNRKVCRSLREAASRGRVAPLVRGSPMSRSDAVLSDATRILFFRGRVRVGKDVACLRHCGSGLLVAVSECSRSSTDPASNLDEVLGVALGNSARPVPAVEGLFALNIDPEAAAKAYRERVVGTIRGACPTRRSPAWRSNSPGRVRLRSPHSTIHKTSRRHLQPPPVRSYRLRHRAHGHTLRLLKLPAAWSGFIDQSTTGTSCLGRSPV